MKNLTGGFVMSVLLGVIALLVIGVGVYIYENKKKEIPILPTSLSDSQRLSLDEINNQSYPKSSSISMNNDLAFTTYKDGLYQSAKIVCNGANTCPEGEYTFSEINKVTFNSDKSEAVVVILSSYAPTLADFHKKNSTFGAQASDTYVVTKSNGLVKITKQ